MKIFSVMDTTSSFLAAAVVDLTPCAEAVIGIKAYWLSQSWPPDAILGNQAFNIIAL